jgi:thiamine biosynthesis lipoprotein
MGLPISVEILGDEASEQALDEVFACFQWVDATFSTYKPESEISRIARGELAPEAASHEVSWVLEECNRIKILTKGYFDAWPNGQLDPSGFVKGWAVERAASILDHRGINRYCVDAGGDMQLRGNGPDGGPWLIGIRHPVNASAMAKLLRISDMAVATSGIYERGRHIYDPFTGLAVSEPLSLTVIGPKIADTDAVATAAFVMGREGMAFLSHHNYEAMMITIDHEVLLTPGFRQYETTPS